MSKPRQYELIYIAEPESSEEVLADLAQQVAAIVSRFDGTIENTEEWGRRKLAYEIAGHKEGVYVLCLLNGGGDMIKEIDRRFRVIDAVIRHLFIRVDEALRVAERTRERRLSRSRRRRIARGLSPDPEPRPGEGTSNAPAAAPAAAAASAVAPAPAAAPAVASVPDASSTSESPAPAVTSDTSTQEEG